MDRKTMSEQKRICYELERYSPSRKKWVSSKQFFRNREDAFFTMLSYCVEHSQPRQGKHFTIFRVKDYQTNTYLYPQVTYDLDKPESFITEVSEQPTSDYKRQLEELLKKYE